MCLQRPRGKKHLIPLIKIFFLQFFLLTRLLNVKTDSRPQLEGYSQGENKILPFEYLIKLHPFKVEKQGQQLPFFEPLLAARYILHT